MSHEWRCRICLEETWCEGNPKKCSHEDCRSCKTALTFMGEGDRRIVLLLLDRIQKLEAQVTQLS